MGKFKEALASGKFVVTVELEQAKGINTELFLSKVDMLKERVDGLNIPDNRSARLLMSSVPASILVKERGGEPICTFACRDRNRMALCADLLGASAMGIENILMVSGDYFTFGDTPQAMPVFDLDSVQAILMAQALKEGRDAGGNQLDGSPSFYIGGVANPQANPLEPQLIKISKKIQAGVDFIQTLDIYDSTILTKFFERLGTPGIKILAGVRLITTTEIELQAKGRPPGNPIPLKVVEEMKDLSEEKALELGKHRLIELIKSIKKDGLAAGVHITADGHEHMIPEILTSAGL
jgi:methylenetetrahydrofolate reductase (NADPH)